jgi:hypothetical protein
MFIKYLTYNYNAQKLLLAASILIFALNTWVVLIFIIELTIILVLDEKENVIQKILTHCFGYAWLHFHLFNQQLWYNSSSFLAPFLTRTHHWTQTFL